MLPIYNEYCQFLKDKTGLELQEGFYWYDKSIIKAFDKQGNTHKVYRLKVEDDLSMNYSQPKSYETVENFDLITWFELAELHKKKIEKLEEESLQLIRNKLDKFSGYIPLIPTSTGKDSTVTLNLVRKVAPDVQAVFNNTTLDCSDTYKMVKMIPNCIMMNPKQGFYQYIKENNIIFNRISRGCCRIFKAGEMVNQLDHDIPYLQFLGTRNQESATRSGYEDEWINISEWGNTKWQGILPIRTWSELDVWLYIFLRNIEVNEKYKKGYSRCGCAIACPYYNKSTWVLDKYWYPTMRKRWEDILREDFISNKKWIIMNCTIDEYINQAWNGGTFRTEPTQEVIDEFAEYNGMNVGDTKVARQYFNKYCSECTTGRDKDGSSKPTRIKSKEVLAMNMKFHGREIDKFLCKKCFKKLYELDDVTWDRYVASFKRDHCALFDTYDD